MNLHPRDIVGHLGKGFQVEGIMDYHLDGRVLRVARLAGAGETRYLEMPGSPLVDRVVMLSEIEALDITMPPPATIYYRGESFLLKFSGVASTTVTGSVPGRAPGMCSLWRYRAAGDRFLQIEAWPDGVRMLEGASVHQSMIEVRPATPETQ